MLDAIGRLIDTEVLVVGAGAGGLWAALSAKRHLPGGRVTLLDAHMVGRTGHTAFSNAWMVVVTPDDDLDACVRDIVEGNEWIAEQELIRDVLSVSHFQLLEMEKMGLVFPKEDGRFIRRPTRGLKITKVLKPDGGGLEYCWRLRKALEAEGVDLLERVFVTDLARDDGGLVTGAFGIDGRTGEFVIVRARATVLATNSVTFRAGFVRDLTGTGTHLAYDAGAVLTNAEFGYLRPGTPKFYFEGITFAIQDGARFVNAQGEPFMERYEPDWADRADVQALSKAMVQEKKEGRTPLYLDMSLIPEEERGQYLQSSVAWMDYFFRKLGDRARIDMFGRTEYYPLFQMTKLGIKTDAACRSSVPGLLAAGLAQASCASHFAGFHIGACNGTGWIAGKSAADDAGRFNGPRVSEGQARSVKAEVSAEWRDGDEKSDDDLLRALQSLIFPYEVSILKHETRMCRALEELHAIAERGARSRAAHVHGFVRLRETRCMVETARLMLEASLLRRESRMSHLREDFPDRDDVAWLRWILIEKGRDRPRLWTEPIATPLVPPPTRTNRSSSTAC